MANSPPLRRTLAKRSSVPAGTEARAANSVPSDLASLRNFDDFYRTHRDSVARALALTFGDAELGADAADEAMVRAYQRWDQVSAYDNPSGWVYRTGLNWGRSWLRRLARGTAKAPFLARPASSEAVLPDPGLSDALASLRADHRAVVVLRLLNDWTVEETAEALGVKPGTVKSRLHRALAVLADHPALTTDPRATETGDSPR